MAKRTVRETALWVTLGLTIFGSLVVAGLTSSSLFFSYDSTGFIFRLCGGAPCLQ
jgi:hypothetical protein